MLLQHFGQRLTSVTDHILMLRFLCIQNIKTSITISIKNSYGIQVVVIACSPKKLMYAHSEEMGMLKFINREVCLEN